MKPVRKCVSCREHKEKIEFLRVVKNKENEVFIDYKHKANGRGAYICKNIECIEKGQKSRALARAYKMQIDENIYEELKNVIKGENI